MYVMSGGVANNTTVKAYVNRLYIYSGGVANNTTVNFEGNMLISSGGTANSTTVNSYGLMYISSGGVANSTTVNYRGNMYISPGGVANSTTVDGGQMYISSGGTATNVIWTPCVGLVSAADGAYVTYASTYSGVYFGANNQLLSHTQSMSGKVVSGTMHVMDGGVANSTTVNSFGRMYISSGGVANSTTVNEYGFMYISSGGVANSTTVRGSMYISGGTANSTTVNSSGYMYFYSGGTANSTTVNSGGYMRISSGSIHRGSLQIESGATVSAYSGAIIDFTVANRNTEDGYLINDLSLIQGTPSYTITVSTDQADGTYKLAQGASNVTDTLTIGNGTVNYGSITVNGNDFVYNDKIYSLDQVDGNLTLTIKAPDIIPPELTITGNATTPTNQDVVLKISANENCTILYNINNGEWQTYSDCITVTANGTVNIKATDEAGNITEKSVVVDKIDKVVPVKPTANADIATVTNGNVTVSAAFSSDSIVQEYSFDNKSWNTYTSGIVMTANGTVYFRGQDEAGNYSEITSYEVTNIDKVAPTLTVSGNPTSPTNQDVVLTASASDGTIEYFLSGKWVEGDTLTISVNGTYEFRATDAAGNVTSQTVVVDMIDKVAPTLEISGNVTKPTNQDVVLNATASDGTVEYFANGKWNSGNSLTVAENGTYQFRVTDAAGNVTEKSVVVDMIDKVAPTLEISGNVETPTNQDVILNATASDGIVEYWDGAEWIEGNSITATENGIYQFRVTDAAGNVTEKSVTVDMIDKVAPTLEISGNVTEPTNKDVVLTATASDGTVEYFANGKWNSGNSLTVAENGTYQFRVTDAAGNVTEKSVTVDMIDKVAPDKPAVKADITGETTGAVTVSAIFSNDSVITEFSLDNKTWQTYTDCVVMESNGTVYFRGIDAAGNVSQTAVYEVNNIIAVPDVIDGDLDGNGLADVILVHTKQGYSGAWLTTGTSSVIKWGSLSNVNAGTEILGTGTLYGSENDGQDIFFADSKSVGAWNVVDGKVTGYKSIMSVNSTTNVLGLGDFNGDGATDILLRSTNGDLGYYNTDGTGFTYLKGLGKEWTVAAIGDLNGDGLDDTVLRHDAGFAGTFLTQENGTVKWANLDTLSNDMTIVGTGDFNGDGVDDVLLQKADGWVGAWLVEDGSVDGFMGICKNKNSIEQIADFNGDGIDDLRVRAGADIGVLYVNGADDTTWQYFKSVGTEWDTSFALIS